MQVLTHTRMLHSPLPAHPLYYLGSYSDPVFTMSSPTDLEWEQVQGSKTFLKEGHLLLEP